MKIRIMIVCLLPLGIALATAAITSGSFSRVWITWIAGAPAIRFPGELNLGNRDLGEIAVARFAIANEGRGTLHIHGIHATCACAGLEREVNGEPRRSESVDIPPRTSVDFILRGPIRGQLGSPMTTAVQFLTNDPQSPSCEIKVHVPCVVGDMAAQPARIFVPNLAVTKTVVRTAHVYDYSGRPRALKECTSSSREK